MSRPWPVLAVFTAGIACAPEPAGPAPGRGELTLLHTADLHSHLFPHTIVPTALDQARGLGVAGESTLVGGFARLGTLLARERNGAERSLYVDSGDLFQGALAYQRFGGEAELAGVAALGLDAAVIGNHDLDDGAARLVELYSRSATFPVLASNYAAAHAESALASVLVPWLVLDAGGLRVGLVGVANTGSVPPLERGSSELGVIAVDEVQAVQQALDLLLPRADVIVALTHLGLDGDRALVRETRGLDVVLGGHQHLALDEPVIELDQAGREVVIAHSGAYGHYLGRLRIRVGVARDRRFAALSHEFALLPVSDGLEESELVRRVLEPYAVATSAPLAFLPEAIARAEPSGADSALGNLVADSALASAPADAALVPSSSLRADLPAGPLDAEALYRALPFGDPLVRSWFRGRELEALFGRFQERARRYGCATPIQVAALGVHFTCEATSAPALSPPFAPEAAYALITTRFLLDDHGEAARPGEVVAESLRDAVERWITARPERCGDELPCVRSAHEGRVTLDRR